MKASESIKNLAAALVKFQAEVKNPPNTANNPFFKSKYAPLNDVLNLVRPLLSKHGLGVIQAPSGDGKDITLTTMLIHESGEWIELDPLTLQADKPTAQGAGSAITYARRYALSAALGISSEDDDDGNIASTPKKQGEKPVQPQINGKNGKPATTKQLAMAFALAKKKKISKEGMRELVKDRYKKATGKELTVSEASDLIKYLSA